jgi:hypothetical protein
MRVFLVVGVEFAMGDVERWSGLGGYVGAARP